MVTDQEIASCVESLLRQSSSSAAAAAGDPAGFVGDVVQQLEEKLGMNLSHKAEFIQSLLRPSNPSPKDHFTLQHHMQQQQHHPHSQQQQQQFYQLQHRLLQHHQIPQSPFTHLPQHHELAFRCVSPLQVHQQHQHQVQQLQQQQAAAATAAAAAMQKQEGHLGAKGSAPAAAAKASGTSGVKRRGGPGGLSKLCGVSPELQAIVGEPALPRTQIVKQLWTYIRKHNLQDPNNKRKIICNDELRLVFETDCTDMFKMNKLLAKHIIPLEPTKELGSDSKRLKGMDDTSTTESNHADCPLVISDELAEFFGTGEKEVLRSEASKRVWDYIKVNQLEDPLNAMAINFDAKLQKLFGCESLSALGVSEMLSRHLFRKS